MKFKLAFCLLLLSLLSYAGNGEKKVESHLDGTILDETTGEPLPGVALTDALTGETVYTDFDGHFSFDFFDHETHTLEISYVTYEDKKLIISSFKKENSITIQLSGSTLN